MEKIYRAAIERWGVEGQYDQAIEECAELIAVLHHYKRGKATRQAVVDEIADVTLMLGQLTWMFGHREVDEAVGHKLAKLRQLLDTGDLPETGV